MMKSDGGAASAAQLSRVPIQTVMSGPVAGVIGSRYLGDLKGIDNLITFDTGGTSSDMAVLPGAPLFRSEVSVGRHPVRTRTVDIDTIGAGGGSIASIAAGRRAQGRPAERRRQPRVPPATSAAAPRRRSPTRWSCSAISATPPCSAAPWRSRARRPGAPCRTTSRRRCGMDVREAAWGVLTVLATNCMSAMRTITVERGYDPREFTLVAFGGMGPTIAWRIAAELGIGRILVPRDPGAFSAWGMLVTDVHQEHSLTRITPLDQATP